MLTRKDKQFLQDIVTAIQGFIQEQPGANVAKVPAIPKVKTVEQDDLRKFSSETKAAINALKKHYGVQRINFRDKKVQDIIWENRAPAFGNVIRTLAERNLVTFTLSPYKGKQAIETFTFTKL